MGTEKHSLASKARWKNISPEKRKAWCDRMSDNAYKRWATTSDENKQIQLAKMRAGLLAKKAKP